MMNLDTIMSTDLVTISPEANLAEARDIMQEKRIHHLPVVDDAGKLVGLITLTDLLAATDSSLRGVDQRSELKKAFGADAVIDDLSFDEVLDATSSVIRKSSERIHASDIKVEAVMVRKIATVSSGASLRRAAMFLEKHRIGCLPVVDDDRLVGIVTDTDFVGVAINLLEQLEDVEPLDEAM